MTLPVAYTPHGLYPDTLGDVRTWLRQHPFLTALSGRVFFRIPDAAAFPLVRIYDAGTVNQAGEAPIIDAQIGVDVWGALKTSGATYADITAIANNVRAAFHLMHSGTVLGVTTVGLNADVTGSLDNPDPDTGAPRKTLTVLLTCRVITVTG